MRRLHAGLALGYVLLTFFLALPLTIHPADRVMSSGPDTDLFMWTLAWDVHALARQPLAIFDANIFHPYRHTLAYSENLIGSSFFAAPVLWTTHNPVLAMNVAALISAPLCALGAYLLARNVGAGPGGAALAGIVFGFSPARFLRLDQLHLAAVQWIPFSLAYAHAYFDRGRPIDARLAIAFLTLQALTSGHGAVFLVVAVAVLVAIRFALGEPLALARRMRDVGLAGVLLLAPAILVVLPYLAVQREIGLRRSLEGWDMTMTSLLASPSYVDQFLASRLFPSLNVNETAWSYLFPGYLPVLLAVGAVCWTAGRPGEGVPRTNWWDRAAVLLNAAAPVSVVVALFAATSGGRIRIGASTILSVRQPARAWIVVAVVIALRLAIARRAPFAPLRNMNERAHAWKRWSAAHRGSPTLVYATIAWLALWLSIGPPFGLWQFVYWLPGFNFIRAPSRFIILAVLGLAVLAAIGFDRIASRMTAGRRAVFAFVIGVLLVAEFVAAPLGTEPQRVDVPAIDRWLDGRAKPFVVAEVPVRATADVSARYRRQTLFMLHSTAHWQKTVHGYSGIIPPASDELYDRLVSFPDEASLRSLSDFGVTCVVVHTDLYPPGEWSRVELLIRQRSDRLRLEHVEGDGRVYSLSP